MCIIYDVTSKGMFTVPHEQLFCDHYSCSRTGLKNIIYLFWWLCKFQLNGTEGMTNYDNLSNVVIIC